LGLHFLLGSWFPEWPKRDHRNGETYTQNNRDNRHWASGAAPHFVHTVSICLAASLGMLIHSRSYQILTALKVSDDAGLDSAMLHSKSAFQSHSAFLLSNRKGKCIPNLTERHSD